MKKGFIFPKEAVRMIPTGDQEEVFVEAWAMEGLYQGGSLTQQEEVRIVRELFKGFEEKEKDSIYVGDFTVFLQGFTTALLYARNIDKLKEG